MNLTRRHFVTAAAALPAIAGCSRRSAHAPEALVSVLRAPAYSQAIYDQVRRLLAEHKLDVRGRTVVLKPNLVEFDADRPINTHPMVVHAALEGLRALGARAVRIAEGPGHRRATLDLADAAGYFQLIPRFEDLFTDLNLDEVTHTALRHSYSKLTGLYLPNAALRCDLLISMPKMKTHHWVGATLSMKNLFGLVPGGIYGWPKNVLHWAGIPECIADLYLAFPRAFALVDGIDGMEGNGPIQGTAKHAGVLVAGGNLAAVDSVCAMIMAIDPKKLDYLRLAGVPARIKSIGEDPRAAQARFDLPQQLQNIRART